MSVGPAITIPTLTIALITTVPIPEVTVLSPSSPGWSPQHRLLATVITVPITREGQWEWEGPASELRGVCTGGPIPGGGRGSWVYPLTIRRLPYHQEVPWAPGPWMPTTAVFMVMGGGLQVAVMEQITQRQWMSLYKQEAEWENTDQADPE